MTGVGSRLRGMTAAGGLLAAVVGVPWVIVAVGVGPPRHLPSGAGVLRALGQPISDHDIVGALSLVCWVVWLLFTVAVVVEAVALVRHRPAPSQSGRGFRIPGLQGPAGALVLAVVLAFSGRPDHMAPPTLVGATTALHPGTAIVVPGPARSLIATAPASCQAPAPEWLPYTVVRYDSPWKIAEEHLGDGLRWREIRDRMGASLVGNADPASPEEATARIIYPGEVLLLPAGTGGTASAPATRGPLPDPQGTSAAPTPERPTAPAPPAVEPPPPHPTPTPGGGPVTVWTGTLAGSVRSGGSGAGAEHGAATLPLAELLVGGAFLASAVINVLSVRRARQAGRAGRGERIPLPGSRLAPVEVALRAGRRDELLTGAHRAVGALASDLIRAGQPPPLVTGIVAHDEAIEVLLAERSAPPPPWQARPDGLAWRLAIEDVPAHSALGHGELLPTLVPIGREPLSGGEVLINLEAAPMTGVSGAAECAAGMVHGAALALAGLPWAKAADVVLIGFGEVLAACQPHMRVAPSLQAIASELRERAAESSVLLGVSGAAHVAAGRLGVGGDGLTPTIVVAAHRPRAEELTLLAEVCRSDTAITALVAGEIAAPRMLSTNSAPSYMPDLRISVAPCLLAATEVSAMHQILDIALSAPSANPRLAPYDGLANPDLPPDEQACRSGEVLVRVLGPVEIDGTVSEFRRPHAREVAVYLAMHPRGAAEHQLDEAIWPARHLVKATTRDPVISSARTALGGPERMLHARGQGPDKRYRTTEQVGTDWELFCELHRRGRRQRDVEVLQEALDLVRGRPFADVLAGPGYAWLHLEGHLHHLEGEIVDAADLACELLLGAGDPVAARRAANHGLLANPYAERLWVRLMAVADALGEAREVERILVEMDRRLDLEGDYTQLHPDTIDAYRRYSRRRQVDQPRS